MKFIIIIKNQEEKLKIAKILKEKKVEEKNKKIMTLPSGMKTTAVVMSALTGCAFVGYVTLRTTGRGVCARPDLV